MGPIFTFELAETSSPHTKKDLYNKVILKLNALNQMPTLILASTPTVILTASLTRLTLILTSTGYLGCSHYGEHDLRRPYQCDPRHHARTQLAHRGAPYVLNLRTLTHTPHTHARTHTHTHTHIHAYTLIHTYTHTHINILGSDR